MSANPAEAWLLARLGRELPAEEAAQRQALLSGLPLETLLGLAERVPAPLPPLFRICLYRDWILANPEAPQRPAAWFNLGVEWAQEGDKAKAASAYQQALALRPDFHPAAVNLGLSLEAQGQAEAALAVWDSALQPDAARTALLNHRGRLLEESGRLEEAERTLFRSLLTDPAQPDVIQHWSHLRQKICAWPLLPELPGLPRETLVLNSGPLGALALLEDPAEQARIGAHWLARKIAPAPRRLSPEQGYRHARIRLGYMSSDFCRHAMSFLIAELLERHDRTQFEVFGYCSSPEDGSPVRQRVLAALDHCVLARGMDDAALAERIRADEIDILIDLNGMTRGARLHTLRWKPAPVQLTYLGYIGPVPLPELDYLLCDDYVIPPAQASDYAPRPLPLPGVYQANDGREPVLPAVSRAEEGLPENGFVFCCFCGAYKITPEIFAAWTDILRQVPHAVLWLAVDDPTARRNLTEAALAAGVATQLIFARRVEPERYLARMALADLFLDTSPYNAGTVASDALRMGLPLLTLSQRSFASRMAGSLLRAVGLPQLAVTHLADYVTEAVSIANTPERQATLRAALAGDAWRNSLGDAAGFTARLEAVLHSIRLQPPG
ncbi:tetratricopeptide repeat protein [Pseudoroseomonas cervicalis]|uniref:O-linked N-acetylglucosamine transferase, SPINDLY family protein n=1 Tax=Teichococcus cervicalis TaxID=204525 RepID=UPI0027820644|nr:tetratricopeptide repeat protein [Pseudoroseomonas cervicalis]MDQ1077735.1 putative O-linked N-acetylglucosamine transferase (SPINDLY family) [Pseudoroseomonas cervicalis]